MTPTVGDTVTFTATVSPASGTGTPTGLVTFFDGNIPIGSGILNAVAGNDQATFSTAVLNVTFVPSGLIITAVYDGDSNFAASAPSPAISETENGRNITQSLVVNPSTTLIGQPITASLTVTDAGTTAPPGTAATFSSTGAPATGRSGFTITPFSDDQVLVAGGTDANGNVLPSAEIYSVSGGGFTAANGNLNTARTGATAVLLPNGKVLVAGGSSDGTANGALASAELFDPVTGTFTLTSQNMTAARLATNAVLFTNGQVLLAGGENSGGVLSSAEFYDPATDTFTPTGSLNVARAGGAAAVVLRSSQVVFAGGSSDGTADGALDSVELFSLDTTGAGKFQLLTKHLSAPRWQPESATIPENSIVLIAGGQNSTGILTSADAFVPGFNSVVGAGEMAVGRANGSAVPLPNRRVLLAGGASGSQIAELYDLSAGRFETTGNLQQPTSGVSATLLNNGQVLTVGLTNTAAPASDAELYTLAFTPALGEIGVNTSEIGDGLTGECTLVPTGVTASACDITLVPVIVGINPHVLTTNFFPNPATANVTVNPALTTTSLNSSSQSSTFGQPVTFTATVADSSPGSVAVPTGTAQFVVDGVASGTAVPLVQATSGSSTATLSTSALSVSGSPHSVAVNFLNADGSFINSNAQLAGGQTVTAAATTTIVASSVAGSSYGQPVTFSVTVTDNSPGATAAPTGSVQFILDGQNFGAPVALTAGAGNGTASSGAVTTLTVNGGSPHTVIVNYLNTDKSFSNSSGSLAGGVVVGPAPLTVAANSQAVLYTGAPFTAFSATLSGFVNGESEAGLRSSGALSGIPGFTGAAAGAVNAGVYAIVPTQGTLAASNYDFPAADFTNGTLIIAKVNATSVMSALATPINDPVNGATLSFLAIVKSTTGGTPTGSVQFADDKNSGLTQLVGLNAAVCPAGTPPTSSCARFSPAAGQLAAGSQTLTASYQGDANFLSTAEGSSPSSTEVTVAPAIDTTPGQSLPPVSIVFENAGALAGQGITLACNVQAASIPASSEFPTCSLSSTTLPADGSVTANLSTTAATSARSNDQQRFFAAQTRGLRHLAVALLGMPAAVLGIILLTGKRSRHGRRNHSIHYMTFALLLLFTLSIGCGGQASPPPPPPGTGGTAAGTYLVTVAGTDTNHNQVLVATIPLNVQ